MPKARCGSGFIAIVLVNNMQHLGRQTNFQKELLPSALMILKSIPRAFYLYQFKLVSMPDQEIGKTGAVMPWIVEDPAKNLCQKQRIYRLSKTTKIG